MRLTQDHKRAFVTAVLADVPAGRDFSEEFRKLINDDMRKTASKKLRAALDDPELNAVIITGYHNQSAPTIKFNNRTVHSYEIALGSVAVYQGYVMSKECHKLAEKLATEAWQANLDRNELEAKVRQTIAGFTTLKAARAALPEFAKYLPEEETKTPFLPAIANLAAELSKAGWTAGAAAA